MAFPDLFKLEKLKIYAYLDAQRNLQPYIAQCFDGWKTRCDQPIRDTDRKAC